MTDEWRNGYLLEDIVHFSPKVSSILLDKLKQQVSNIVEDNVFIVRDCPRIDHPGHLVDVDSPFFIKAPLFRNCSLVANFFGPFTAREVAYMMDMTMDSVYHIEKSAIEKLKARLLKTMKKEDILP